MPDYDQAAPRLWIGSAVDPREAYEEFDILVLAAEEYQPQMRRFAGHVLYSGFADSSRPIDAREKRKVIGTARTVARALFDGQCVLSTCRMGWNRSSLVAACALKLSTSWSCEDIIGAIRMARGEEALSNQSFVDFFLDEAPITYA